MSTQANAASSGGFYPRPGDRPFRQAGPGRKSIVAGGEGSGREMQMWYGYFRAGAALVDDEARYKNWPACLTYPALFAYRHALEIAMKAIIRQYGPYARVPTAPATHNLLRIWDYFRRALEELGHHGGHLDALGRIVADFHELDFSGTSLRYAYRVDGSEASLPLNQFDLENLVQVMERVECFFDLTDMGLEQYCYGIERMLAPVACPCCRQRLAV